MVDLLMERAVDLLRLEAGTRDKVLVLLDALEQDIAATITNIDPLGPARVAYQRQRLEKLQTAVTASIRATYRTSDVLLAKEIRDVADVESTWTGNAINAATHAEFVDAGLSRTMLDALVSDVLIAGAPTSEWWSRQAGGLADRFADEMRRGVALGETNGQLIDRVRGTNTTRGLMDIARSSAERLVRSSVQTVANTARNATYDANSDLIAAVQWHATLDTRTTEMCMARDGHQYDPKTHEPLDDAPPWLEGPGALHWGCRSTSIPILKSWRDLGIDEDEVPQTTRASMDGQVPADLSFEGWLKKQSVARQDDALGAGKAQLWRSGKIGFRDLLDQSGRPLTTEQLRAKAQK
jgi:SPP1 gp7 family putative phage head morphogenesis protein